MGGRGGLHIHVYMYMRIHICACRACDQGPTCRVPPWHCPPPPLLCPPVTPKSLKAEAETPGPGTYDVSAKDVAANIKKGMKMPGPSFRTTEPKCEALYRQIKYTRDVPPPGAYFEVCHWGRARRAAVCGTETAEEPPWLPPPLFHMAKGLVQVAGVPPRTSLRPPALRCPALTFGGPAT